MITYRVFLFVFARPPLSLAQTLYKFLCLENLKKGHFKFIVGLEHSQSQTGRVKKNHSVSPLFKSAPKQISLKIEKKICEMSSWEVSFGKNVKLLNATLKGQVSPELKLTSSPAQSDLRPDWLCLGSAEPYILLLTPTEPTFCCQLKSLLTFCCQPLSPKDFLLDTPILCQLCVVNWKLRDFCALMLVLGMCYLAMLETTV